MVQLLFIILSLVAPMALASPWEGIALRSHQTASPEGTLYLARKFPELFKNVPLPKVISTAVVEQVIQYSGIHSCDSPEDPRLFKTAPVSFSYCVPKQEDAPQTDDDLPGGIKCTLSPLEISVPETDPCN